MTCSTFHRHSYPADLKASTSGSSPSSRLDSVEEIMLQHSDKHPWLCLCLYKPLLCLRSTDIALKVALHLQSVSPHLCVPAKSALLTLVFMPILHQFAGTYWECLPDTSTQVVVSVMDDIVFIVLGMVLQFLEESSEYLILFIRHGGLTILNKLLELGSSTSNDSSSAFDSGALSLVLDLTRIATSKPLPTLSNKATVAIFKPSVRQQPDRELEVGSSESLTSTGSVRSFFRGISFSWGNDKRRVKDMKERSSTLDIAAIKRESSPSSVIQTGSSPSLLTDELEVYVVQLKRFVQGAVCLTGATLYDFSKDRLKKTMSFVRAVSGADSTDSENDPVFPLKRKRRLSETSGYKSTSQEQLYQTMDRSSYSNQSVNSFIMYTTDNIQLPGENDLTKWKKLSDIWSILDVSVPVDGELCSIFVDMNGFNVALKLLKLLSQEFTSHFDHETDFTQPTPVQQSLDNSFALSASLHSSTDALNEKKENQKELNPIRLNTIPKINLPSPQKSNNLKKTASLDDILSETFKFFRPNSPSDSAINTPESVIDLELQQQILDLKLSLFTSCLRICFFCAKLKDQVNLLFKHHHFILKLNKVYCIYS